MKKQNDLYTSSTQKVETTYETKNSLSNCKSPFTIVGHIFTGLSIIGFTLLLVLGVDIITSLILFSSDILIISLLYGLGTALTKIKRLEHILHEKKLINYEDSVTINESNFTLIEPQVDNITFCKKCGYQLFPEDKECPNCKTPKEKQ